MSKQCQYVKALCRLAMRSKMAKYPNTPERLLPLPKYSDKTANGLTKCVVDFLKLNGWQAERVANMGRVISDRTTSATGHTIGGEKWVKGTGKNGTADIHSTIAGRSVKIEVKIGRDFQSEEQIKYQKEIEAAGGVYIIARTFKGFYLWYESWIKEVAA